MDAKRTHLSLNVAVHDVDAFAMLYDRQEGPHSVPADRFAVSITAHALQVSETSLGAREVYARGPAVRHADVFAARAAVRPERRLSLGCEYSTLHPAMCRSAHRQNRPGVRDGLARE